jgi:hypothetical protein
VSTIKATPLEEFTGRQSELNRFLWSTELIYGIVKEQAILKDYPQRRKAWDVFSHIRSEAWFPPTKAKGKSNREDAIKYKGSVGQLRLQLDKNFVIVLWTVAAMFVAEFESYVESRFPKWVKWYAKEDAVLLVPAPARLLKSLCQCYGVAEGAGIVASVTLKADLMKKIRNLYVHKGLRGIPRKLNDAEIARWIATFGKAGSLYSMDQARRVAGGVIGGAIAASRMAATDGKQLGEEFFYALYMFTNIRNFVVALDASFPSET